MPDDSPLRTPLHAWHRDHGGRMVEFGGWSMPVQYSTIVEEHQAVRLRAGLFDISHMGRLSFDGPDALDWLNRVTTNNVARLSPGKIQYSLMVAEDGGVLDDILVYYATREWSGDAAHPVYLVVCNASNRAKVVAQFDRHRDGRSATLHDWTPSTTMIALQGPASVEILGKVLDDPARLETLAYYSCDHFEMDDPAGGPAFEPVVSRTGYTGEDGFELVVNADEAVAVWDALLEADRPFGLIPCGLGARDTLRFEAAMPLYGHEIDETINPYEAGLGWAVKLGKGDFIGREALRRLKAHPRRTRVGLELEGKRIARQGCEVKSEGRAVGTITSGTFSPTLGRSLAMALVEPAAATTSSRLSVNVRGHNEPARIVPLPFYRR